MTILKPASELSDDTVNNAVALITEQIKLGDEHIKLDRAQFTPIIDKYMEVVAKDKLIVSDVSMITTGKPSGTPIHVFSPRSYEHAKSFADIAHKVTKSPYVRMRTVKEGEEFVIEVDTIAICQINQLATPKKVSPEDLVKPQIVNNTRYLPAEVEIIEWCRVRSMPEKFDIWNNEEFQAAGKNLFSVVEQRIKNKSIVGGYVASRNYILPFAEGGVEGGVEGGKSKKKKKKFAKKFNQIDMDSMGPILKDITSTGEAAVIGEYAYYLQSKAPGGDRARGQLVISFSIDYLIKILRKHLPDQKLRYEAYTLAVPNHAGYIHWSVTVQTNNSNQVLFDVYGFGQSNIIPSQLYEGIVVGSKWISLRVMFINIWKLQVLRKIAKIDDTLYNRRVTEILKAIKYIQAVDETCVQYFGSFVPEITQNKLNNLGKMIHMPYFPAKKEPT